MTAARRTTVTYVLRRATPHSVAATRRRSGALVEQHEIAPA